MTALVFALNSPEPDADQTVLPPAPLSDQEVHEFEAATRMKGLTFEVRIPDDLPMILVDRARTKQVLYNIINNAINATESGGVTLEVLKRGPFVEFLVSDTGSGISPEKQDLLFQKFRHLEQALTHDATKGTGLGLYLSKLLVSALGGEIGLVKSEIGKGSTFRFTLPVAT